MSILNVPVDFVKEVNRNIFSFVWNFKPDKVRRKTMVGPICKGGLSMVNNYYFSDVVKSLNIAWVNRYCKVPDSHWCTLLDSMLHKVGGAFLFQCNYELKLLDLKDLPAFFKNVLAVWQELNSRDPIDAKEIQQEILWNNRFIMISGKSIYYKTWVNKGILRVCNLLDTHGQFLCFEDFKCKFGVRCTLLDYAGVLAAIPKHWKSKILGISPMGVEPFKSLTDSDTFPSTKKTRLILAKQSFSPPIVKISLSKQVSNVKDVYELPFKVTMENKSRSFQFKIMHNIIPTNLSLHKMNIKESPHCEHCLFQIETLVHMLLECSVVEPFWKDVITWWNIKRSDNIYLSYTEILYGYKPESKSSYALNHYLLIAKYHIFLARHQSESPSLKVFLALLESKIRCEREMVIKNSNCRKYEAKWTTLCICDA